MKYLIILSLFIVGCTHPNENLRHRILTDQTGCTYMVSLGIGETVFLYKNMDNPKCEK